MSERPALVVVVDAANVVGSRPDGWWRDRAGAATRLVGALRALVARVVEVPDAADGHGRALGHTGHIVRAVHVVLEGQARAAAVDSSAGVEVVRAAREGDDAIVALAGELTLAADAAVAVVTADRGLRSRLPAGALAVGPRWLWAQLEAVDGNGAQHPPP